MFELKTHMKVCVYVDEGTCQLVCLTDVFLKFFCTIIELFGTEELGNKATLASRMNLLSTTSKSGQ